MDADANNPLAMAAHPPWPAVVSEAMTTANAPTAMELETPTSDTTRAANADQLVPPVSMLVPAELPVTEPLPTDVLMNSSSEDATTAAPAEETAMTTARLTCALEEPDWLEIETVEMLTAAILMLLE